MYSEARKLHLIEDVLKISNESTLVALDNIVKKFPNNTEAINGSFLVNFYGIWSKEEAEEIECAIEKSCGQVNLDEWT